MSYMLYKSLATPADKGGDVLKHSSNNKDWHDSASTLKQSNNKTKNGDASFSLLLEDDATVAANTSACIPSRGDDNKNNKNDNNISIPFSCLALNVDHHHDFCDYYYDEDELLPLEREYDESCRSTSLSTKDTASILRDLPLHQHQQDKDMSHGETDDDEGSSIVLPRAQIDFVEDGSNGEPRLSFLVAASAASSCKDESTTTTGTSVSSYVLSKIFVPNIVERRKGVSSSPPQAQVRSVASSSHDDDDDDSFALPSASSVCSKPPRSDSPENLPLRLIPRTSRRNSNEQQQRIGTVPSLVLVQEDDQVSLFSAVSQKSSDLPPPRRRRYGRHAHLVMADERSSE